MDEYRTSCLNLQSKVKKLESCLEEAANTNVTSSNKLLELQLEIDKKQHESSNLQYQIDRNKEQITNLQNLKLKNEQELFRMQNELNSSQSEVEKFKQYQETIKGEYGLLITQKNGIQEELLILTNSNKNYERSQINLEFKIDSMNKELLEISEKELTVSQSLVKSEQIITDLKLQVSNLETQCLELQRAKDQRENQKDELQVSVNSLKKKVNELSDELDRQNGENSQLFCDADNWKSRYQSLEMESKQIIGDYMTEREQLLDKCSQCETISQDRLIEVEQKSWEIGKLLLRLSLAYAELDRMSKYRKQGVETSDQEVQGK